MGNDHEEVAFKEKAKTFEALRDCTYALLRQFGQPDFQPHQPDGDYDMIGDFTGDPQVVVFVHSFELLRPAVVSALQQLVKEFPGWEIEVTVAARGHYEDWPNMGLYVRPYEIIDGLQRSTYLRSLKTSSMKALGTAYD